MPDVIIIGAGISGLSCAWTLKKLGVDAVVVESSSRAGGVIRTERLSGYQIECGPNSFQPATHALEMIDELGLSDELITPDARAPRFIYIDGQLKKFPLGPMSFGGMMRVLWEPFVRSKSKRDESVKEFFSRRFGRQLHDRLVAPMLTGIYAANTEHLSMKAALPAMVELEREYGSLIVGMLRRTLTRPAPKGRRKGSIVSFKSGMETLTRKLAQKVSVKFNVSDARVGDAKATVITAPAYRSAELVESQKPELARLLREVLYAPMVIAATSLPEVSFPYHLRGFGFLAPRDQGLQMLGTLFSSALFEGRAPEGRVLLTSFVGGSFQPDAVEWPDERVWETVCSELEKVLQISQRPQPVGLFRHHFAIPQYNIGHERWVELVRKELKQTPGLFITANYMEGVAVPACMEQGERTAHAVAEYLRRSS